MDTSKIKVFLRARHESTCGIGGVPPLIRGYAVAQLVEALCYKLEGGGFDSRWSHWNFSVT